MESLHGFSVALECLLLGGRITRRGWNGAGMWLELVQGAEAVPVDATLASRVTWRMARFVLMRTAKGTFVPWAPDQTDLLERDWVLLAPAGTELRSSSAWSRGPGFNTMLWDRPEPDLCEQARFTFRNGWTVTFLRGVGRNASPHMEPKLAAYVGPYAGRVWAPGAETVSDQRYGDEAAMQALLDEIAGYDRA